MRFVRPAGLAAVLACGLALPVGSAVAPASARAVAVASAAPSAAAPSAAPSALAAPLTAAAAPSSSMLRKGATGAAVRTLQKRLSALGYWLGAVDGEFGDATFHAVVALQKAAGLARDGVVGPATRGALAKGVRPKAVTKKGHVIEVDLKRQLVLVVDKGRVRRILDASTGSNKWYTAPDGHRAHATTPKGTWRVSWQVDGWHKSPLGRLYRPKYFHVRGIAVHGYPSVPAYPASHGCVRVTLGAMDMLWSTKTMRVGTTVRVH